MTSLAAAQLALVIAAAARHSPGFCVSSVTSCSSRGPCTWCMLVCIQLRIRGAVPCVAAVLQKSTASPHTSSTSTDCACWSHSFHTSQSLLATCWLTVSVLISHRWPCGPCHTDTVCFCCYCCSCCSYIFCLDSSFITVTEGWTWCPTVGVCMWDCPPTVGVCMWDCPPTVGVSMWDCFPTVGVYVGLSRSRTTQSCLSSHCYCVIIQHSQSNVSL